VLHAFGTEQSSEKAAAFSDVWERWHVMSKAQQTHWEHTYLLVCAYAEANACLPQHYGWLEASNKCSEYPAKWSLTTVDVASC
jgi:hypothetical protein